ncbi:MAG: SIS domain-containing protein [Clostridiales bacterium]|nr:SIS domain-containing protein [Clostridiales bacterium]
MDYGEVQAELHGIIKSFFEEKSELFNCMVEAVTAALKNGRKIVVFGNGGSAAEAQHFAAELVNKFLRVRKPIRAIALTTDTSTLTSIANDSSYDEVFSRQIDAIADNGDIALALSTSGMSANIIKGLETARAKGLLAVAMTGQGGGKLGPLADYLLDVPSSSTPRIQEVHLLLLHLLAEALEERPFLDQI